MSSQSQVIYVTSKTGKLFRRRCSKRKAANAATITTNDILNKVVGALDKLSQQISRLCDAIPTIYQSNAKVIQVAANAPAAGVTDDVVVASEEESVRHDDQDDVFETIEIDHDVNDHDYLTNNLRSIDQKRRAVENPSKDVEHIDVEMLENDVDDDDNGDDDVKHWKDSDEVDHYEEGQTCDSAANAATLSAAENDDNTQSTNEEDVKQSTATKTALASATNDCDGLQYIWTSGGKLGTTMLYTINEKQLYRRKKEPAGAVRTKERYICRMKTCKATMYLQNERLFKLPVSHGHNHGPQEEEAEQFRFRTEVRKLCRETGVDPQTAFEMALKTGKFSTSMANSVSVEKMKRHCLRLKRECQSRDDGPQTNRDRRQQMCLRCAREPLQVIMSPCMHAALCEECRWQQMPDNCPRCGDVVERVISFM